MTSPQAQFESERPYYYEDELRTPEEQKEYEQYMEELYWEARAAEREEEF